VPEKWECARDYSPKIVERKKEKKERGQPSNGVVSPGH
jgi:hypothetical protein